MTQWDKYWETTKEICWNCGTKIIEYYSKSYKGKRARCPGCKVDFPLE